MKKLSIVVPVYNKDGYVETTIGSLCAQSVKDCEIILIDDGSTDSSGIICDKLAINDKRISVKHINNKGVSNARNMGIEIASGEYIAFMDADDLVDERMYEKMIRAIEETGCDMAICGTKIIKMNGDIEYSCKRETNLTLDRNESLTAFLRGGLFTYGSCNKVYKRSVAKGIRFENGRSDNEDKFFMFQAIEKSNQVVVIGEPLFINRKTKNSITTSSFNKVFFDEVYFSKKIQDIVEESYPFLKKEAAENHYETIMRIIRKICREKKAIRGNKKELLRLIEMAKQGEPESGNRRYKAERKLVSFNPYMYCALLRSYYFFSGK